MNVLRVWAGLALAVTAAWGCRAREQPRPETELAAALPAAAPTPAAVQGRRASPFESAARCRIDHAGMFLDLGTEASHARRSFLLGPFSDVASDTWSDQSYTRFVSRDAHYDFWLTEPSHGFELRVRAKAGSGQRLTVRVDDQLLGTARPSAKSFQTLAFPGPKEPLAPGRHTLTLRWSGRTRSDDARRYGVAHGMVEWIHWAAPGEAAEHYRAPRQRSLRDDVVLGGEPRRALLLTPPSALSCPVHVMPGTDLKLGLGRRGEGELVARVTARRDGTAPRLLAERRLGESDGWTDLTLDLDTVGPQLVDLEIQVTGTRDARLAVSEPHVVATRPPVPARRARLAVLVVASGLHRELLPPFAETRRLRHVAELARASARFTEYRVPTTVVGGVVASLLTGLSPIAHGFETPKAHLSARVQTLADRLREVSGESAMWTGVPHTRGAFGFDRAWTRYEAFSPVNDVPAAMPLTAARAWLERARERDPDVPRLIVAHVRGGHPPWDLSREESSELEPREYGGLLEARRGGIILGTIRSHSRLAQRRLAPPDWVRLRALQVAALAKQDEALGALVDLLERSDVWDETLFIFAGDVASGDPPEAPFGTARPLTEDRLLAPLWVKFPGAAFAGRAISGLTTSVDVAATIAHALGLRWPETLGEDLHAIANGTGPAIGRSLVATLGQDYATRWGDWLLRGSSPKTPVLCHLDVDPACAQDVLAARPVAARALWRATFDTYRAERQIEGAVRSPELAELDRDTAAALQVWGE